MKQGRLFSLQWLMALLLMVACGSVFAGETAEQVKILNAIGDFYKPLQTQWYSVIKGYAIKLFWLLVLVDVGWSGMIYILEKNDPAEIAVSMTKKIFPIGFFWSLLKLSDTWIPAIINSFVQIGQEAGGSTAVTPDGIIVEGASLAIGILKTLGTLGIWDSLGAVMPLSIIAIIIFLCYCFVAVQLLVTLIESYIVIGAGVILLGFGGSRWTTDFATKYLQNAVGTGLKLMMLYLILGAGKSIFGTALIDPDNLIATAFAALGAALVYAYLAFSVPAIASGMMSGSPALTAGGALGAAVTMGAAMAGAAAATSGGASAAAGAAGGVATGGTGLAKALGAGYSSALDAGKSGLGAATGAVGEVAKHSLGLAAGGIGDAVNQGMTAFAEKVDASTGGQIANSIEATRGGSMSGSAPTSSPAAQSSAPAAPSGSGPSSSVSPPAPSSASTVPGSSSTSPASSAPAAAATASSAPTGGGSAPVSTPAGSANASSTGDASSASIGPGSSVPPPTDTGNQGQQKAPLHERINSLQGYVPQDMAPAASINIQAGHTAD